MNVKNKVRLLSGRSMPIIGLGTWELTEDTAGSISTAIDLGIRMIDTSGDYGTQPGVGEGIRASGIKREDIYLVTKVEETDDSYKATRRDLEELEMTYADLIIIHRPPEQGYGKELWEGLIRAKEDGFAKDIGVSNYSIDQLQSIINNSDEVPVINQIEWTPFGHELDMLDFCNENGIRIQAYSPLTRGQRLNEEELKEIATNYGKSPSQVILRWDIQLGVIPIVKAGQEEHLKEDLNIFDFELSDIDMQKLSDLNEAYSSLGSLQYFQ
ncbi:MAG: aldo/keto reductase [Candidatus Saccharimonadales bacterium]